MANANNHIAEELTRLEKLFQNRYTDDDEYYIEMTRNQSYETPVIDDWDSQDQSHRHYNRMSPTSGTTSRRQMSNYDQQMESRKRHSERRWDAQDHSRSRGNYGGDHYANDRRQRSRQFDRQDRNSTYNSHRYSDSSYPYHDRSRSKNERFDRSPRYD